MSTVLILAPHADDGELGCGGAIARFIEGGREVHSVVFSLARASVREGFPDNILETELKKASAVLGIPRSNVTIFDYPVRHFPEHRQAILDELIVLRERIDPDLIFMPTLSDIHQDHQVIAQEALRAFKHRTILAYEEPWNNVAFESRGFVPIAKRHVERKVEALMCYVSQRHRKHLDESFIWSLARVRGTQVGEEFAEAFEIVRWVLNRELDL